MSNLKKINPTEISSCLGTAYFSLGFGLRDPSSEHREGIPAVLLPFLSEDVIYSGKSSSVQWLKGKYFP